ncbi:DUF4405 domain-containing protein [Shewanella sp. SR44-3]|uniref:DUF4405 domain-containing protein n=1 Tax=unclassified Shewanella TaxID=196818 RepID=UPI0015FBE2EC|nr:DUF4405 domain-containing protein [Shewanella sp. SR44-3]MBB1271045.1 DUF4405 domain-containing protein [Shewanella sp. SR44-3]
MNLNRFRPYAAITMMLMLALLAATGLLLYLAPHGQASRLWSYLGIAKHQYKDIHLYLGLLVTLLALLHGYVNFKPLSHYLAFKRKAKIWTHPLIWALLIVITVVILVLLP